MTLTAKPAEPEASGARLAEVIYARRPEIVERLVMLDWGANLQDPLAVGSPAEPAGPRVEGFMDLFIGGLETDDWTAFDLAITAPVIELLGEGLVTLEDVAEARMTLTAELIKVVLEVPDAAVLIALVGTVQALSNRIVSGHNRRLLDELRRVDDVKTMFLRVTTHELRGPLGTIRGYASMLESGDFGELEAPVRSAVVAIARAVGASLGLLDRLGEMARLESGAEPLTRASHPLAEVVAAAVEPLREAARLKGVELDVAVTEESADVDLEEMAIAVRNLTGNALKYGAGGGRVTVQARLAGYEALFEVADFGPGIREDELERVFDRYYRSTESRSAAEGSGLGLHIVRRIAELHGGTATAESQIGKGSTFQIRIPAHG